MIVPADKKRRQVQRLLLCLALAAALLVPLRPGLAAVFGYPNGAANPNGWFILTGPGSADADGDATHTMFFKMEVTGTSLSVLVWDPGNSGARDLVRSGNSTTTYTLRDPAGAVLASTTIGTDNGLTDDKPVRLSTTGFKNPNSGSSFTVVPGLYELEVTMDVGMDVNAFGLSFPGFEAYTATDAGNKAGQYVGGALNSGGAPVANITQPVILYPYVDRGCQITTSNYDMDWPAAGGAGASGSTVSRLGTTTALTMSGQTVYANDTLNPIQLATKAQDYGIWRLNNNIGTQQNILDWRIGDYTGVTIVGAFLPVRPNNPIRLYLPADGSLPGAPVAPLEPRLEQSLTPLSQPGQSSPGGPNPPIAGPTSWYEVNVGVTNPTVSAMTDVTVTANVPGGQVLYACSGGPIMGCAQVSGGGTIVSQPADGGSGNVVVNWATIAAGATVSANYFLAVTPAGAGAVNVTATPASVTATRAIYTPAFSSVTFPGTEPMGAICQLTVQASTSVPNAVALSKLEAHGYAGAVWLEWDTASEWANLGFNVYRAEGSTGRFAQLNDALILGAGTSTLEASYLFIDPGVRDGRSYSYLIEDVERTGKRTLHGPVTATAGGPDPPAIDPAAYDRVSTLGGELPPTVLALLPKSVPGMAAGSGPLLDAPASSPTVIPATAAAPEKVLKILSQDSTGMVIEIRTDAPSLSGVTLDGVPYTDVRIQGFAQAAEPGRPALPALGLPIEIPDVADVTMAIEQVKSKTVGEGVVPAPAPLLTLEPDGGVSADHTPDPAVYGGGTAYPAAPVRLGGSVRQGESRLLVLVASPVVWSPAGGVLTHARRVRLRLDFHGAGAQASASGSDPARENQFYLAGRGALKIAVEQNGLQAVTGAALINAGLDPAVDPRRVSVYREGREVAVLFQGEEDGVLDAEDLLLFHGENRNDDHALARSYWLTHGNLGGRRMALRDAAPSGQPSGEALTDETVRLEKNLVYLPFVLNGESSNFVGDSIFLNPRDQMLTLKGVSGGEAILRMRVQGATSDSNVNPDHHMVISVNGIPVGDALWDGFSAFEGSFPVPVGALQEGANQIRLTPVADTGAIFDFDYVDWIEISHPRSLGAAGETLAITTGAAGDRRIEGIVGQTVILLDVTDPDAPVRLTGAVFIPDAAGGTLEFRMAAGDHRVLLATDEGIVTPAGIAADLPSALHDTPGTDWLAIAHEDFLDGAAQLAGIRALEGHRARVVDVQDVYDEFGHGDPDPRAIRDYLAWQYAQGGDPRLRYVLLVGDASYDERNYLGQPNRNFVSSKLLDGTFTERSSDNWFASFVGNDTLPDVALGRLPVKSAMELDSLVAKIAGYSLQPLSQEWQARALLVADDGFRDFHAGEAAIFEGSSDAMAAQLPPNFDPLKLFLSDIPEAGQQTVARQVILDTLNAGALTAVYTGHGAITLWADEVIFRTSDLALLSNADRLPFVMVLNCLNGLFSAPLGDALGESMLLQANGGAAAFFAPTGVSPIGGQDIFGEAVMRAIFQEGHTRIGDSLVRARESILGLEFFDDLSESWVLLGDPAMRLAFLPVPIADAGEDIETLDKNLVRLQGSVRGGAPAPHAYAWRLISAPAGSRSRLDKAGERKAQFKTDAPGAYVIELVVSSGDLASEPDTLTVLALPHNSGKQAPDGF